jgi:hypothetical protein
MPALMLFAAILAVALLAVWLALRRARRLEYIRSFVLPRGLFDKLRQRHPQLSLKDCQLVAQGLRQFFAAYLQGGKRHVSMPSQVADDLWHEYILYTRNYAEFCRRAFGGFLHHTPAAAMAGAMGGATTGARASNEGLRRCWWWCCKSENINPRQPTRLPLLFALDAKLGIEGGFRYLPDCNAARAAAAAAGGAAVVIHCGADFGDASIDGGTAGFAEVSGSTDGGDGGGGDGGCGGGCGS